MAFILVKDVSEGTQRFVTKIGRDFRTVESMRHSDLDRYDMRPSLAKKFKTREQAEAANREINDKGGYDDYRVGTLDELTIAPSKSGRWI